MIKILMIVPELNVANGVASVAMNYFRNLDSSKYQVDFAVLHNTESPYIKEIESKGGKIYVLPSIKNFSEHIKCCRQIISFGDYDVVHDHSLTKTIPLMVYARRANVPVRILHSHSSKLSSSKIKACITGILKSFLINQTTTLFACSDMAAEALFGSREYEWIPNGIDVDRFSFNPSARSELRRSMDCENKVVFGSVGRLAPEKNPYFAVDVFEEILKKIPEAEYWWLGSGLLEAQVREKVKSKGLEDKFKLLGSHANIQDFYQAMDILLLPSFFEGLPLVAVEAQASGLPIIMSDTITKLASCSKNAIYLAVESGAEAWAEVVCDVLSRENIRDDGITDVIKAGYDNKSVVRLLAEKLERL